MCNNRDEIHQTVILLYRYSALKRDNIDHKDAMLATNKISHNINYIELKLNNLTPKF